MVSISFAILSYLYIDDYIERTIVMKIGLLSMQRVVNYGSFWQAYCLKKMICDQGNCTLEFIDIIPGDVETRTVYKRAFSFSKIKRIPYYLFQNKKKKIFFDYQRTVLGCTEDKNYQSNYDSIIIGSDEVFNFVQESPWGFSTQLYGDIDNQNVSTYAACFGNTTYDAIQRTNREETIHSALNNIQHLSVRDENSAEIIEKITHKRPEIHLDPVLVGEFPDGLPNIKEKNYILVYSYDFRLSDPDIIKQVRSFAREKRLSIISVGFYQDWVNKNVLPNPLELLSYFKNADYVITDTFHGTIFSTRMHRQFVTVIRNTNKEKLGDLLSRIGLKEREYDNGKSIKELLEKQIDYSSFEEYRMREIDRSKSYLKKCIER